VSESPTTPPTVTVEPPVPLTREERLAMDKARRGRNIAIALGLVAFIVIVYAVTLIRMGGNVSSHF
jgi:hypothetical protein